MSVSEDKRGALTWFVANAPKMRAMMATTLATGVNDLTTVTSSMNGYQRLVNALSDISVANITTALNSLIDSSISETATARASKIVAAAKNYALIPSWANISSVLARPISVADKNAAVSYFADSSSGVKRRAAYDAINTYDGANPSSKILSSDLTTWSAIQAPIDAYVSASPTTLEITTLFGGMSASSDKRAALTWFVSNAPMMRAMMATTLATGVNDLTTVTSSMNGYQRLVNALGATPITGITTALNALVAQTAETGVIRAQRIAATLTINPNVTALLKNITPASPAKTIKDLVGPFMSINLVNAGGAVTLMTPSLITADVLTAIGGATPVSEPVLARVNRLALAVDVVGNPGLYANITPAQATSGAKAKQLVDALMIAGVLPSKITPALVTSVGASPASATAAARAAIIKK
jgi:hypothetical protein